MKLTFASFVGCAAQDVFLAKSSSADLVRANTRVQPGPLAGMNSQEIADKLNAHLGKMVDIKECDIHSIEELNALLKDMFELTSPELEAVYKQNDDSRAKRFDTLEEYEEAWAAEASMDLDTLRHAKCAEIGSMFAHHLSEDAKKAFDKTLPTIPVYDEKKASDKVYATTLSCKTGHAMIKGGDGTSTHQWPDWPEELHYKAKGHGAYPFWWGGGSDSGTADLEVWWSEKQGYELFYHSTCTGLDSWNKGGAPCYHLMLAVEQQGATPVSYLFNEAARQGKSNSEGGNCCLTNPTSGGASGPAITLNPSQGNFWNTFKYMGTRDFNGVYYKGTAKYYVLTNVPGAIADFWYFTDMDDKPVQQGEAGTGPSDQGYPTSFGHTIWHDYKPDTLDTSAQDASIADVPAVCKTTTASCPFP
jgi:hypothetical protein